MITRTHTGFEYSYDISLYAGNYEREVIHCAVNSFGFLIRTNTTITFAEFASLITSVYCTEVPGINEIVRILKLHSIPGMYKERNGY